MHDRADRGRAPSHVTAAMDSPLPDFDRLSISRSSESLEYSNATDGRISPRGMPEASSAPNVVVHVTSHGSTTVTINTTHVDSPLRARRDPRNANVPVGRSTGNEDIGVHRAREGDPASATVAATRASAPDTTPQSPATSSPVRPGTIRGGGRVAPWDPALEHIEAADPRYKKWYVITAGRRVGIWCSWLDMEDYIDVKGCRYQKFETRAEAEFHYYLAKREGRVRLLEG